MNLQSIITYVSDGASIFSFILTFAVFLRVKNIENRFLRAVRLPELTQRLQDHASKVLDCYNSFESSRDDILHELAVCTATLNSIMERVDGRYRRQANSTLKELKGYIVTAGGKEGLMQVYTIMTTLVEDLKNDQEDEKWKSR